MLKAAQRKAPGPDNLGVEVLRFDGEEPLNKLHEICNEVWQSGSWLKEWTQKVFIQILKKVTYSTALSTGH